MPVNQSDPEIPELKSAQVMPGWKIPSQERPGPAPQDIPAPGIAVHPVSPEIRQPVLLRLQLPEPGPRPWRRSRALPDQPEAGFPPARAR